MKLFLVSQAREIVSQTFKDWGLNKHSSAKPSAIIWTLDSVMYETLCADPIVDITVLYFTFAVPFVGKQARETRFSGKLTGMSEESAQLKFR
jgi:hypothetical protein